MREYSFFNKVRKYISVVMLLAISASLFGCAKREEVPEVTVVPPMTNFLTEEAYERAAMWECDDTALFNVMQKAGRGEPVTIACIGGSITQGTIAKGDRDSEVDSKSCYANLYFRWWSETFPDTDFTFINAGIGATNSYLGVHRVYEDVLVKNPDLVLIEYAVNDGGDNTSKKNYENLLRKALSYESKPAVMLLFMAQTNGATAQSSEALVGINYGVPMLSYANAISQLMSDGTYSAKELSGDEVHPSALGHAMTGEIIWRYFNKVYAGEGNVSEVSCDSDSDVDLVLPSPTTNAVYENARILDSDDIVPDSLGGFYEKKASDYYPNGWVYDSEIPQQGITFTATFKNLGILYINQKSGNPGKFDVLIDGKVVRTINADFKNGWGDAINGTEVYSSAEEAEHTITIIINEESEGTDFRLLGLLVS